jgi:WD40 repeat protein
MNPILRTSPGVRRWLGVACPALLTAPLAARQPQLSRTLVVGPEFAWVAFSPDGKTLASGSWFSNEPAGAPESPVRGEIQLWDAATGRNTATLRGHTQGLYGLTFSPACWPRARTAMLWALLPVK